MTNADDMWYEVGATFGGSERNDTIDCISSDDHGIYGTMHSKCCRCSVDITFNFFVPTYYIEDADWYNRLVICKSCGVKQTKKLRIGYFKNLKEAEDETNSEV